MYTKDINTHAIYTYRIYTHIHTYIKKIYILTFSYLMTHVSLLSSTKVWSKSKTIRIVILFSLQREGHKSQQGASVILDLRQTSG